MPHIGRRVGTIEDRAHTKGVVGDDPDRANMTLLDRDHGTDKLKTDDSN